ncbi:MAG: hypothetical protein LCI00_10885 [Chloroflexi bacterium]|nr:hypothetical protein [Chloroflexota bacterium]
MKMNLAPGEPHAGLWRVIPISEFVQTVFDSSQKRQNRPWIVAVDGRSGSGKSTLANRLHRAVLNSAVVHTDDVAWHHSFFGWSDLLIEGILKPLRLGEAVSYQPPGWQPHGRTGSITIPAGLDLIIIEGVGASRTEVMPYIDRSMWVQSDFDEAKRRCIARDGDTEEVRHFWEMWMTEELVFVQQQRPWERAALIVNGTPQQPYDQNAEIIVASTVQ